MDKHYDQLKLGWPRKLGGIEPSLMLMNEWRFICDIKLKNDVTLSPAKILKLSMTCSAVSVSVDSLVMKSKNESNDTKPEIIKNTLR